MSDEDPFCVPDYSTAGYNFDSGFDYDPSTSSFSVDPYTDFTYFDQEQTEHGQTDSATLTPQYDDRISGLFSAFLNKEVSATEYDDIDSDSSGTVGNLGYSPHDDSEHQSYFNYGEDLSLDDLDLSTPAIPSTPNSHYDAEKAPTDRDLSSIAPGLLPEHSPFFSGQPSFRCSHCSKTFDTKSKFTVHVKYHDKSLQCSDCDKTFGVKQQLKRHWKEVHEKRRISCPVRDCEKEYSRMTSVKRHISNKHSALYEKLL